jgi:hypothetical protein
MTITNTLRRVLDRKEWEMMTPATTATVAAAFVITDPSGEDRAAMYVAGASAIYRYDHNNDAWQQLPNSGIAGTFGAGSCGTFHHYGPNGTATAGTTTTLTTNLTLNRRLDGYKIVITSGPGAGNVRTIASNTLGANSVITVTSPFSATITTSSTYQLYTGRYWFFNAGSGAVGFSYYDRALNTWTSRSVTNLPTTFGTDGRLINTFSSLGTNFASGTATSATATTLVNSAKTWTASQWINYQIRITGGTGAGQIRTITANNDTSVTVSTWTTTPDATSTYEICGNDDNLYLIGNNAVTMYKYSISGNSWSTLSPGVARAAAPGAGGTGNWISGVTDALWTNESAMLNGRRIYSFRGGGSAVLDYYDIPSNAWSALTYWPQTDTFTTGSSADYDTDYLYYQQNATGRIYRLNIATNTLFPWSQLVYPQGTAVLGDKTWIKQISDGATTMKWLYTIRNTGSELFRCMLIDADV